MQFIYKKGLESVRTFTAFQAFFSWVEERFLSDYHLMALVRNEYTFCGGEYTATLKVVVVNRRADSRSCGIANSRYVTSRTWHKNLYNEVFEDSTLARYTFTSHLEYR